MRESDLVDVSRIASALHCSDRQVQLLAAEGMPKAGFGKYDLRACLEWYEQRSAEKHPWRRAQKRMATLASRALTRALRREMAALPARIAPQLEGLSRAEIVRKLRVELRSVAKDAIAALPTGATLQEGKSQ